MYNGCSQCNCAAGGTTAQQAACNVLCFTEFWGTRSRFSPCSMTICIQAQRNTTVASGGLEACRIVPDRVPQWSTKRWNGLDRTSAPLTLHAVSREKTAALFAGSAHRVDRWSWPALYSKRSIVDYYRPWSEMASVCSVPSRINWIWAPAPGALNKQHVRWFEQNPTCPIGHYLLVPEHGFEVGETNVDWT